MKLVYKDTNKEVNLGDVIKHVHHNAPAGTKPETLVVTHIEKPRHGGSTGRVYASKPGRTDGQGFFPSVFDMEWIEREDQ